MPRYSKQQLDSQYAKLPQVLREAIFSAEIAEKMYDIGHRNGLNIEKTGFLAEEAGYIVLGLTRPREFVAQLAERLEVTTDKAKEIASQVNHEIFFPLHEALKQTHGVDVREETIEKAEPLIHEQREQLTRTALTIPPAAGTQTAQTDIHEHERERTPLEQALPGQAVRTAMPPQKQEPSVRPPAPPQSSQARPQQPKEGETIDLRQRYRPKMPEGTPPSKIPPINLRVQREEARKPLTPPQVGTIPKQGVSFAPKPQVNAPPAPKPKEEPQQTIGIPAGLPADGQKSSAQAGENIKTSPFGISSGRLVEDFEKKMQPPPPQQPQTPLKETPAEKTAGKVLPAQQEAHAFADASADAKALADRSTGNEETPKPPESVKPPISSPPPNVPLKDEVPPQPARKQDPYREPVE